MSFCCAVVLAEHAWNFLPGGNGREWKLPKNAEVHWTEQGLYLHGRISDGMELQFAEGLDADAFPILKFCISTAEYTSASLYFAHDGEEFSDERRIRFGMKGADIAYTGQVDCRTNKHWKGTIRRIRLNPIVRELDNSTIRHLYFCDDFGGMAVNGSFETPALGMSAQPDAWIVNGKAELISGAYLGKNAVRLAGGASIAQEMELRHEYPIAVSLVHKTERGGKITLIHKDIYDKEISRAEYPLRSGMSWTKTNIDHAPPKGTAYVQMQLKGDGAVEFDAVRVNEIRPSSENYRWWDHSHWIWDPANMNSENRPIFFRKRFKVRSPEEVERMVMQVVSRNVGGAVPYDEQEVFLNGRKVTPAFWMPKWTWASVYELKPYLQKGDNILAIRIVNRSSPGGLNVDMLIVNPGDDETRFQREGSGPSWKVSDKAGEGWTQLSFNDEAWRKARVRGQATPGSFCRLPYRFFGTAGTMDVSTIGFPAAISSKAKYDIAFGARLNTQKGYKGVLAGASLHFHLIDSRREVTVKLKRIRLTPEMLGDKLLSVKFPFDARYLRKGNYTLRVYGDALLFASAPDGFTLNGAGNFLEREIEVIDEQHPQMSTARISGWEEVPRINVNGVDYPAQRFTHGRHTQFTTEESLDIVERVHSSAMPILDVIAAVWYINEDGSYDFSAMDTFFMSYLTRHPEAYINLHQTIDTAGTRGPLREWILKHPETWAKDDKGNVQSGTYLAKNIVSSMASKAWQEKCAEATAELVRHFRESPYADRIIGFMPSCGLSNEWMYWGCQSQGFMDYSEPYQEGFREFAKQKYGTLDALNAAYQKAYKRWADVQIPTRKERMTREFHDFLSPETNRATMDMREFLNMTVSDAIIKLCHAVKQASDGRMMTGVYYGYSLYVTGPYLAPFSGHHALRRLLDSPDVDYLFSPCRYDDRGPGGASGSMLPVASLRIHKKLFMDEADNRLLHSWDKSGRANTLRDSRNIIEREFAYAFATSSGLAWLDFGEGWLPYDSRLCTVFENCLQAAAELSKKNAIRQDYENAIAVVMDEKAIHHAAYDQRLFLNLVGIYPHLLRTGAAIHWYLVEDMDKLEPYKCIVFTPTVTHFTLEQKEFLEKRLKSDKRTLVFLYSNGVYGDSGFDISNAGAAAGFAIDAQKGFSKRALRRTQEKDAVFKYVPEYYTFGFAEPTEFYLAPQVLEGATLLFTLDGGKRPGMVKREYGNWTSIYCSAPRMGAPMLRGIAEASGIRIVNAYPGDVTYVAKRFFAVHTDTGGKRVFNVPKEVTEVKELFSNRRIPVKDGQFECVLPQKATLLFTTD